MFSGADISSDVVYFESLENESLTDFIAESKAEYVVTKDDENMDLDIIYTQKDGKITFKTNGTDFLFNS